MANNITLEEKFTIDNVLTNVTSVKLSDPTGTFGVKCNETETIIVADGTAMTNTGTGVYRYTFEEEGPDYTYTYWVEWVYAGETYHDEHTVTGSSEAASLDAYELALCNESLGQIGQPEITAADTTKKAYLLCQRFLSQTLDEIVGGHPWNKAVKRTILVEDTYAPLWGYDHRYAKPADSLRIWKPEEWDHKYEVEEGYIITDEGETPSDWADATKYLVGSVVTNDDYVYTCITSHTSAAASEPGTGASWETYWTQNGQDLNMLKVCYLKKLTCQTLPWHVRAPVITLLASKLAVSLQKGDTKLRASLVEELEKIVLPNARYVDSQEGTPLSLKTSTWLDSRQG